MSHGGTLWLEGLLPMHSRGTYGPFRPFAPLFPCGSAGPSLAAMPNAAFFLLVSSMGGTARAYFHSVIARLVAPSILYLE